MILAGIVLRRRCLFVNGRGPLAGVRPSYLLQKNLLKMSSSVGVEAIQVHIRVRPLISERELLARDTCVHAEDATIQVTEPLADDSSRVPRKFRCDFDSVLGPNSPQLEVYETVGKPCAEAVLDGYNATIFAYGQTGSGKTHTMFGQDRDGECRGVDRVVSCFVCFDVLDCPTDSKATLSTVNTTFNLPLEGNAASFPVHRKMHIPNSARIALQLTQTMQLSTGNRQRTHRAPPFLPAEKGRRVDARGHARRRHHSPGRARAS